MAYCNLWLSGTTDEGQVRRECGSRQDGSEPRRRAASCGAVQGASACPQGTPRHAAQAAHQHPDPVSLSFEYPLHLRGQYFKVTDLFRDDMDVDDTPKDKTEWRRPDTPHPRKRLMDMDGSMVEADWSKRFRHTDVSIVRTRKKRLECATSNCPAFRTLARSPRLPSLRRHR